MNNVNVVFTPLSSSNQLYPGVYIFHFAHFQRGKRVKREGLKGEREGKRKKIKEKKR